MISYPFNLSGQLIVMRMSRALRVLEQPQRLANRWARRRAYADANIRREDTADFEDFDLVAFRWERLRREIEIETQMRRIAGELATNLRVAAHG
jgi:hypothetical protein